MIHEKILKHILALFFVLVLLTLFAVQWEKPVNVNYEMLDRPLLGPEEMQRTIQEHKNRTAEKNQNKESEQNNRQIQK